MKYLAYAIYAALLYCTLHVVLSRIVVGPELAATFALPTLPLCVWTGRLVHAARRGVITRRMPALDGGPTRRGQFWSFRPDVYKRRPGFDNFKGYFIKECSVLALLWVLFLAGPVLQAMDRGA